MTDKPASSEGEEQPACQTGAGRERDGGGREVGVTSGHDRRMRRTIAASFPGPMMTKMSLAYVSKRLASLRRSIRKRLFGPETHHTKLDLLETFAAYRPNSSGEYAALAALTVQTIRAFPSVLVDLVDSTSPKTTVTTDLGFDAATDDPSSNGGELRRLFDRYGSDKASSHNYYLLYERILRDRTATKVFEIGLGTNNVDVVSHMGENGRPGASLRAFRDHLPDAEIFGADFDRRILFSEDRIRTYFVDQTDSATFVDLGGAIGDAFDLMIDDGLHSPDANIRSLAFFLPRLKVGGWAVVEDIDFAAERIWELVARLLPDRYEATIYRTKLALLFAVRRKA